MNIWFKKDITISEFEHWGKNTLNEHLEIKIIDVGDNFIKASMPVDHRTHQPYGLLHGGASAALAETLGSVASAFVIDRQNFICVGIEINANHIHGVKTGLVVGTCIPIHIGSTTHVCDIRLNDENNKLICASRLTVAILKKKDSTE